MHAGLGNHTSHSGGSSNGSSGGGYSGCNSGGSCSSPDRVLLCPRAEPLSPCSPLIDLSTKQVPLSALLRLCGGSSEESGQASDWDSHENCNSGDGAGGTTVQAAPTALDARAERRFVEEPLRDFEPFFTREQEESEMAEINASVERGVRGAVSRTGLAEKRMIRRLTVKLSRGSG